jgi:Cys-tRNA(Pro)/Cys-tRNA(Cys) deacylase
MLRLVTPAVRALEAAGVWFAVHEFADDVIPRGGSSRDFGRRAADALGVEHERVFKTLVVTADAGHAVAVVPVSGQLAPKAMAAALGVKHVDLCDPTVAQRLTGYVVGGISPLGQRKRLPTVVDETCVLFDTVFVSGGRRGMDVEVRPDDLTAVTGAVLADITVAA